MSSDRAKVIFLGTFNASRSQMAESYLRQVAGDRFEVFSAGLDPLEIIDPEAVQVMAEAGWHLHGQRTKSVQEFLGKVHFGHVITVCDHAESHCPTALVGISKRYHWDIRDPHQFEGNEADKLDEYARARDAVQRETEAWLTGQ